MNKSSSKTLISRVFSPIFILSTLFFAGFGFFSFQLSSNLMERAIIQQSESATDVFARSVRDPAVGGRDYEVELRCRSILSNPSILGVKVFANNRLMCDFPPNDDFHISRRNDIYFDFEQKITAGHIEIFFNDRNRKDLASQIILLVIGTIIMLLIAYLALSSFFIGKVTSKFTKLATRLSNTPTDNLTSLTKLDENTSIKELDALNTSIKKMVTNIQRYQEELVESTGNAARNETARLLAHDIKSPLTAIQVSQELIGVKPAEATKLIHKAVQQIEGTIEKIMDGQIMGQSNGIESTDLHEPCQTVASEFKQIAENLPNIQFDYQPIGRKLRVPVAQADLAMSIRNLIKNAFEACEHTSNAKVLLAISIESTFARVTVSDNGPGIPPEVMEAIGEKGMTHGKEKGTGFGLFQVKTTAESAGGFIRTLSAPGKGAKFIIYIPYSN